MIVSCNIVTGSVQQCRVEEQSVALLKFQLNVIFIEVGLELLLVESQVPVSVLL